MSPRAAPRPTFRLTAIAALIAVTACGNDKATGPPGANAELRLLQASADAPALDVYVDGAKVMADAAYADTTGFLTITPGAHRIAITATGGTDSVLATTLTAVANAQYTVLAVGAYANITTLVATDTNSAPASGDFTLRIIQASPSAGPVDVYVTGPDDPLPAVGDATLANVPFKAVSAYIQVAAGTYRIRVTQHDSTTTFIDGNVIFTDGQVRTLVALDMTGGGTPGESLLLDGRN